MGLLLGASIVSVVEALDYFLMQLYFQTQAIKEEDEQEKHQPEISVVGRDPASTNNVLMTEFGTMNY